LEWIDFVQPNLEKPHKISAQLSWPGRPRTYKAPRWGRQGRMYSAHTQEMGSVVSLVTRKPCKAQTETRDLTRPVSVEIELFFRRPSAYVGIRKRMEKNTLPRKLLPNLRRTSFTAESTDLLLQATGRRQLQTRVRVCVQNLFWMYFNAQRYWMMTSSCAG